MAHIQVPNGSALILSALQKRLEQILYPTASLCFIGHGAWGVMTKAAWIPFFTSVGIAEGWAWRLMPLIGLLDISLGILLLVRPCRIILLWMTGWCLWTAFLRPLSGQSLWEVWERAGNYGAPFVLLVLAGGFHLRWSDLFDRIKAVNLKADRLLTAERLLRFFLALLLLGHAGFGAVLQKEMLMQHYVSIGLPASLALVVGIGWFEMVLAGVVLFKPTFMRPYAWNGFLIFILIWKTVTEMLYFTSGPLQNIFEWIERWGDYGIPLALLYISHFADRS